MIGYLLYLVLWVFFVFMLARLVLEWIQVFSRSWQPRGPMLVVAEAVYTVTDPPLRAVRKVIPPLRLGGIQLDLAFIVLIIAVSIAMPLARQLPF